MMIFSSHWLGLMIGNSRLHWAYFKHERLKSVWKSEHTKNYTVSLPFNLKNNFPLPLYFASVVPSQTLLWQNYQPSKLMTLADIPLKKRYPSLGIDRALAVCGAGEKYGFPCLVIDGGTALTLTGVDKQRNLVGGAILAGLSQQFVALSNSTAVLPHLTLPQHLPSRWGMNTDTAIESGIIYTLIAGIREFIVNWLEKFPDSVILFTGGDGQHLLSYLQVYDEILTLAFRYDEHLIFWGMQSCLSTTENY